jgi:hypothetical protein
MELSNPSAPRRAGRLAAERDGRLYDLSTALRVDCYTLSPVAGQHHEVGGKAGAFDMNLQTVTFRIADRRSADAAGTLGPAA